ncbi:MAG: nitroreductase family protein [Acidobacteriaceae bacterium]|nr:nitroreductase family protein [Acidobacteriaceae bacterium]
MAIDLETLKHAPAEAGLHELLASRWSPRSFSDKKISDADLKKIFTAASYAASSTNEQPWRFFVGRHGETTYDKIFDALVPGNQGWAKSAPVLILSVAKKTFASNGNPNDYALHDTGAASANMALQAIALGIHTHGMGGFSKEQARANFHVPDDYEIGAVWAMGYLGDPEALPEPLKARELAPRQRKGLGEFVFESWETPAKL